mgnify:CR=1 FL=1
MKVLVVCAVISEVLSVPIKPYLVNSSVLPDLIEPILSGWQLPNLMLELFRRPIPLECVAQPTYCVFLLPCEWDSESFEMVRVDFDNVSQAKFRIIPADYPTMTDEQRVIASTSGPNLHSTGPEVVGNSGMVTDGKRIQSVDMWTCTHQELQSLVPLFHISIR